MVQDFATGVHQPTLLQTEPVLAHQYRLSLVVYVWTC